MITQGRKQSCKSSKTVSACKLSKVWGCGEEASQALATVNESRHHVGSCISLLSEAYLCNHQSHYLAVHTVHIKIMSRQSPSLAKTPQLTYFPTSLWLRTQALAILLPAFRFCCPAYTLCSCSHGHFSVGQLLPQGSFPPGFEQRVIWHRESHEPWDEVSYSQEDPRGGHGTSPPLILLL